MSKNYHNLMEDVALRMPHPLRQLIARYKSYQLDQARRGGDRTDYIQEYGIARYHAQTWDALRKEQDQRLVALLQRAGAHNPYYQQFAAQITQIKTADQLNLLPTVSKAQAHAAGDKLYDTELIQHKHYTGHTSGTTGSPFTFKMTFDALRINYILRDEFYAYHGFNFDKHINLRLGGRLFISTSQKKPPFWIYDSVTRQLMFSLYHMSEANLSAFVKPLLQYRPDFITGYPSSIYQVARFCANNAIDWRPQSVFSDSETVLDYQREAIRTDWGCEIHDSYGMEVGLVAGQCTHGKYHLMPLTSIIEILDDHDQPAQPGEIGELVITALTNQLMPFIRYRTGDAGVWSTKPCTCGWNTPTLDHIEGRMDDIVMLPNGRKIGRLDHIFKTAANIRECQIIQETPSEFTFLLVPEPAYSDSDAEALLREAQLRLGNDITIEIQIVDTIPRTSRGKFRSVISKVGRQV